MVDEGTGAYVPTKVLMCAAGSREFYLSRENGSLVLSTPLKMGTLPLTQCLKHELPTFLYHESWYDEIGDDQTVWWWCDDLDQEFHSMVVMA